MRTVKQTKGERNMAEETKEQKDYSRKQEKA